MSLNFKKAFCARLSPGALERGGEFALIVGRSGFDGFIINPRVQLALFVRRAAGVFIQRRLRGRPEPWEFRPPDIARTLRRDASDIAFKSVHENRSAFFDINYLLPTIT